MCPFEFAATTLRESYNSATFCRSKWHAFSSTYSFFQSFAPQIIVASVRARVSDSISTFATSASDLCRSAKHRVKQACAYALCTALLSLVHAVVGTFGHPLVRLGKVLRPIVPDDLARTVISVFGVVKDFWHGLEVRRILSSLEVSLALLFVTILQLSSLQG